MDLDTYVQDIYPQGLLFARTIRSPAAKGRLISVECPTLPAMYTMLKAKDIPGINRLESSAVPILAENEISYIGEPAAILVGPDKAQLEEYAFQCKVIVDEEAPVFSDGGEVFFEREIRTGNADEQFAGSAAVVSSECHTGIQDHWYAEPTGAVACCMADGKNPVILEVTTATQWPFHVKRSVAQALNFSPDSVYVKPSNLGIHLDGKFWYPSLIACHASLAALKTGSPVKLILGREEDFRFSPKRCETWINISTALDKNGKITGTEINISVNLGSHEVNGEELIAQTCLGSLGFYKLGDIKLKARALKTNIPPAGPFAGFGLAQGLFAIERHIAKIIDMNGDPVQWRKDHFDKRAFPFKDSLSAHDLLDKAASMSDFYRKWASYELLRKKRRENDKAHSGSSEMLRGIGITCGFQGSGLLYHGEDNGDYCLEAALLEDGTLEINSNMVSGENKLAALWQSIAAEILSLVHDKVRINYSSQAPDCGPSCSSRNITSVTQLLESCCIEIREKRSGAPLPITVRKSAKPQNGSLPLRGIPESEKIPDAAYFSRLAQIASVVEIEIDPQGFSPVIRGVWLAVDGGKIASQGDARQALYTGVAQALGWSFSEHINYSDGQLDIGQYENYSILGAGEIPSVKIEFLNDDSEERKGIGELPHTCVPAAYMQAISQALDYHFTGIPVKKDDFINAEGIKEDA